MLHKSIATVRRLEGHVLHPRRDRRGVYWFDPGEVERLCRAPHRAQRWARSRWLTKRLKRSGLGGAERYRDPAEEARGPLDVQSLADLVGAGKSLVATARRGKLASREEVMVSLDALGDLIDALELSAERCK
jgi:hypothetical protein